MLLKENKGKQDPQFKREYYVNKIPLYLRTNKHEEYSNLFSGLENVGDELCNLDESNIETLRLMLNSKETKQNINQVVYSKNSRKQNQMEYGYEKRAKEQSEDNKLIFYHKYYYQSLVRNLEAIINDKKMINGKTFIYHHNLAHKIKLINTGDTISYKLSTELDQLTHDIFLKVFSETFTEHNTKIEDFSTKDYYYLRNRKVPFFDKAIFNEDVFFEDVSEIVENEDYND